MVLDPISALGLAASVAQFLTLATTIVSKGYQIYKAADGTLSEHRDVEQITNDLVNLNSRLTESLYITADGRPSKDELALEKLCVACANIGQQLLARLQQLKVKGPHRKWKSARQALRSVWSKQEVDAIAEKLAMYREELEFHILVSLRKQVDVQSLQQTRRFDALDQSTKAVIQSLLNNQATFTAQFQSQSHQMEGLHRAAEVSMIEQHEKTRSEITTAIKQLDSQTNTREWIYGQTTGSDSRYNPDMIPHTLSWADRRCQPRIMQIRDSLKFPTMQDRQEDIPEAHKDTFNWIFDDDQLETRVWDSFHNWLRTGDGIYWINGKAGSGKSTLMKYLYQDPRTWDALGEWSGKRRLVKAGFFFWNSGTALQKTQEGLLRGVLLDVLRQCPSLIEVVIPDQCTRATYMSICEGDYQWSQSQLKRAFHNLLCHKKTSIRIFLLIDGIDEYEGDYGELADLLKAAASPSVKIAISSRPYNIFEDAFGDLPRMRLQDLTRRDITAYVDGTLGKNERMMKLIRKDPERAPQLVNEITEKASGVFLWVVLVVKSLLNGLRNHDKIQDLQSRLLLLPADLEALYKHMLGHIDPLYRFQRSQFLQIMQAVPGAPLTMGFSLAAEDDAGSEQVINAPMKIITQAEAFNVCEEMERRLRAACAGLLEVDFPPRAVLSDTEGSRPLDNHSYHRTTFGSKVQYLHRTVRDWFERTEVWGDVTSLTANTPFDPNMSLLRGWILRLKVLPVEAGANIASYGNGNGQIWEIVKEAIAFAKETKVDTDQASAECLALIQELDNIVALLWLESGDRCLWIDGRPMLRKFVEEQGLTSKCIDEPVMEVPQKEHRSVVKLTIAGSEKTVDARRPLSARIAKTLRLWGS